jgi:hypothetical protein
VNLLAELVDDAGLFPPESLPMADALARHRADEAEGSPLLSGRFLCPASRIAEARWSWTRLAGPGGDGPPLRLGVILDTGFDGLDDVLAGVAEDPTGVVLDAALVLEMLEVPAPAAEAVDATLATLTGWPSAVFVEGPRGSSEWVKAVAPAAAAPARAAVDAGAPAPAEAAAGAGAEPATLRGAKIRCGGARADLFPSPDELAAFVCACFEHGVPFKATAGLHGAVRHRDDETGFVHHGFLNLVLAAVRAASGASVTDVAEVLASTDGPALAAAARAVSAREVTASRLLFRGYGSCSTSEPREEAAALGLLR